MKKPRFVPPVEFHSKPDFPDDLEEAQRLLEQLQTYRDSLQMKTEQLQELLDQSAQLRLTQKFRRQNIFHK